MQTDLAPARPDVEALNPALPQANRAGSGYMLSTNMLPHQTNKTSQMRRPARAMTYPQTDPSLVT